MKEIEVMFEKEWYLEKSPVLGDERSVVWLDIETRKVAAPSGWPYRTRWEPFMVSVCGASDPGIFWAMVVASEDEGALIEWMRENCCGDGIEIRYGATRDFDEMVLRGLFTNARRALSPRPGPWPNLNCETVAGEIVWRNISGRGRKDIKAYGRPVERAWDCASIDAPYLWALGGRNRDVVATHCLRDSVEIFLRDPEVKLSNGLEKRLKRILNN